MSLPLIGSAIATVPANKQQIFNYNKMGVQEEYYKVENWGNVYLMKHMLFILLYTVLYGQTQSRIIMLYLSLLTNNLSKIN